MGVFDAAVAMISNSRSASTFGDGVKVDNSREKNRTKNHRKKQASKQTNNQAHKQTTSTQANKETNTISQTQNMV